MRKRIAEGALDAVVVICGLAFMIVPFCVPVWHFIVTLYPEAAFAQQLFAFAILSAILLISVGGAFLMWVVGALWIIMWTLLQIWMFLGP